MPQNLIMAQWLLSIIFNYLVHNKIFACNCFKKLLLIQITTVMAAKIQNNVNDWLMTAHLTLWIIHQKIINAVLNYYHQRQPSDTVVYSQYSLVWDRGKFALCVNVHIILVDPFFILLPLSSPKNQMKHFTIITTFLNRSFTNMHFNIKRQRIKNAKMRK